MEIDPTLTDYQPTTTSDDGYSPSAFGSRSTVPSSHCTTVYEILIIHILFRPHFLSFDTQRPQM